MTKTSNVSIAFSNVFMLLGEKLYSNPNVFIRENVQNAVDAIRLLSREGRAEEHLTRVEIRVNGHTIEIEDWGIGMSEADIKEYFWTIGKSSKNNPASIRCNVIGKFGIGAFANFGVCHSLEVHSWRKGFEKVKSRVLKEDLLKNKTEYVISSDSSLAHFGTLIIGETSSPLEVEKLRMYLEEHVKYLPEQVSFNKQLISTHEFPSISHKKCQFLSTSTLPFNGTTVKVDYYAFEEKLYLELSSPDQSKRVVGLLSPEVGGFAIFLNRFLISTMPRFYWLHKRLSFSGFIETNLIEPNVTREGLDADSSTALEEFVTALSDETLEILTQAKLIFKNPDTTKFISQLTTEKAAKYLKDFQVRVYGGKKLLKLEDIVAKYEKAASKVLLVENEVPLDIASMANNQNVIPIMLSDLNPDLRRIVAQYLKDTVNATSISDFELKAVPLKEGDMTRKMVAVRAVIREVLIDTWALTDPQVVLCQVDGNNHISVQEIGKEIKVLVNVKSTIFKHLEENAGASWLKVAVGQLLIAPYLGEVLIRLLPKDYSAAIAMFKPKPHFMRIKKISVVKLIRGSGWKGPDEECIEVKSILFRDMEGYYIRLPVNISEQLKPIIASSSPPIYLWFADTVICLFQNATESILVIQVKSQNIITNEGRIQGTVKVPRRPLIYDTGVYIPIPVPPLGEILPFQKPVDLEIGFRGFGLESKTGEHIKDIDILR